MVEKPTYPEPDYSTIVPELRPASMARSTVWTWCNGWYEFWRGASITKCPYMDEKLARQWRRGWRAAESIKGSKTVYG